MGLQSKMPLIIATGVEYENFLCKHIRKAGYRCDTTPTTGDQGVDLIVQTESMKVAVQCKFYSSPVGNDAVQQVAAGKVYYRCKAACVVSNMNYTDSAIKLAKALKVELLHHTKLLGWLDEMGGRTIGVNLKSRTLVELKKKALKDICACEKLGWFYYKATPPMYDKAKECFDKIVARDPVARLVSRKTILTLAHMYAKGLGCKVDRDKSFEICRAAGIKVLNGVEVPPAITKPAEVSIERDEDVVKVRNVVVCPRCSAELETECELMEGQHIRCMVCGEKFAYSSP